MTRDDIVATLERAADPRIPLNATDCALLRALADALREGKDGWYRPESREITMASIMPAYRRYYEPRWIIPEPKVKP